ncbi:MAG TPA: Gfo/Idh/MocA family oxidoreductase [Candidatus Obscuribacterales bacterium]
MQKLSLAVVGCGQWGPNLIAKLLEDSRISVKHACDRSRERLEPLRHKFGSLTATTDYGEILDDPEVEAVVIATPTDTHFTLAREALLASKHVLVEQPMCSNLEQAKELVQLAREVNRTLMVDQTLVYHPGIQHINKMIEKRETGYISYLNFSNSTFLRLHNLKGGIWNHVVDDISVVYFLLGEEPHRVHAIGSKTGSDNHDSFVYITLEFESKTIAHLNVNCQSPVRAHQLAIGCEKKTIYFDALKSNQSVQIYDTNSFTKSHHNEDDLTLNSKIQLTDMSAPAIEATEPLALMCHHFVDCLLKKKKPLTDGEAGLRAVNLLHSIETALTRSKPSPQVKR